MKKFISYILILASLFMLTACDMPSEVTTRGTSDSIETSTPTASASETDPPVMNPNDIASRRVIVEQNEDGVIMEVTVQQSYQLDDMKGIYLAGKSNDYLRVTVKITNGSGRTIYQWLPSYCHDIGDDPHNHEITYDFSDGNGHSLVSSDFGYNCPMAEQIWALSAGKSETFFLYLAAGEREKISEYGADLFFTHESDSAVKLYDEREYENGRMSFSGSFGFAYSFDSDDKNDRQVSVNTQIVMQYEEKGAYIFDPALGDSRILSHEVKNEDDIALTVRIHGYRLGNSVFYHKSDEDIRVDVTITNDSEKTIYQTTSGCTLHAHELDFLFTDGRGNELTYASPNSPCTENIKTRSIEAGKSKTINLKLSAEQIQGPVALDTVKGTADCEQDVENPPMGLKTHEFAGELSFSYRFDSEETAENDRKITAKAHFLVVDMQEKIVLPPETTHPSMPPETTILETTTDTTTTPPIAFTEKPVIYFYPEKETKVTVKLDYKGKLLCTYPPYNDLWHILARPDGTLTNLADGKEYSYLFWDGIDDTEYDLSRGYCVKGEDTAEFLQNILSEMGMTPREYNEFIVYWLPRMQQNPYNLITFQKEAYTEIAPLTITPNPDSMLRVFMVYQPLTEEVEIEAPEIEPFEREGFTVVEWGGREVH